MQKEIFLRLAIRNIGHALFAFWPSRMLFIFCDTFVRRMLWLWGHARLAALIGEQGTGCVCHWNAEIKYPERIVMGDRVVIGLNAALGGAGGIRLGNDVRLSRDVILETAGLDFRSGTLPYKHVNAPIHLQDGVWVGARAIILGGVTVGTHAVVAAGAIVTKDVAAFSIVAGNPAKQIGTK
jgi:maltose O-acetyltransferase